jgi:two-component system, NtrC family, sensor kinase
VAAPGTSAAGTSAAGTSAARAADTARMAAATLVAGGRGMTGSAAVLSALPQLVYWKDLQGRYLGANETFLAARGLADRDVIGFTEEQLPVRDVFSGTLPPLEAEVISSGAGATGVQSLAGEREVPRKVLLSVVPLQAPGGEVGGVVGVGADVTELSELDRRLSHASRLESIGRLAAAIAHQINTPVQFITDNTRFVADGVAQLVGTLQKIALLVRAAPAPQCEGDGSCGGGGDGGDGGDGGELRAEIVGILDGVDLDFLDDELPGAILQSLEGLSQIAQIVSGLKGFSKPEGAMVPVDLNRAVDNAVELAGPEWLPVADLRLDLDPDIGTVVCYEGEIRQVLLNLVLNAAQAVAARREIDPDYGGGLIQVSTRREPGSVVVEVSDDGIGMDEATRARVFDPFFTTKALGQATGQGLNLAYTTVVRRHQGTIEVRTAPLAGATFTVTMPVRPERRPPLDQPA